MMGLTTYAAKLETGFITPKTKANIIKQLWTCAFSFIRPHQHLLDGAPQPMINGTFLLSIKFEFSLEINRRK